MALFSLSDIKYKAEQRQVNNANLIGGPYSYELHRFPEDLGNVDKGHYMIFHISVSNLTNEEYKCSGLTKKSSGGIKLSDVGNTISNIAQGTKSILQQQYGINVAAPFASALNSFNGVLKNNFPNATDALTSGIKNGIEIGTGALKKFGDITIGEDFDRMNMTRKTTQIKDTIALYMPNTLSFTQSQSFSNVSRNDTMTNLLVGGSLIQKAGTNEAMGSALAGWVAGRFGKELGSLTNSPGTVQLALAGTFGVENPRIEILYTKPEFRQLRYDFMFYPRSSSEAKIVQNIIRLFKYHQSPELKSGTQGQFLVPPSEFDIEFFYNGRVNMNVPKVKSCVLSSVDVDYAPNGFRAYESFDKGKPNFLDPSLGGTGMPVAIRLSLSFQETAYFTKDDYRDEDNV